MTAHAMSDADRAFRDDFFAGRVAPAAFDHRAHLRLAYVLLVEHDVEAAVVLMRDALRAFLVRHGIDAQKYHETLTRAWLLGVRHFMAAEAPCASADEFLLRQPRLLDARIMRTHYSAERLASPAARSGFVAPDLAPIPGAC